MLWTVLIFLLTFIASLVLVAIVIVCLPAKYFVEDRPFLADKPPLIRWPALVAKNLLGIVLTAVGVGLSIPGIPGQGLITILIGLSLVDFPGKRRLVRLLARRRWLQRSMNGLRARLGRSPLEFEK